MMKTDFCDGVFAPVCSPEVCDVPRIPYKQTLVIGHGIVKDSMENDSEGYDKFYIHIYREFFDVFGKLTVEDSQGNQILNSTKLECFHGPTEEKMVAIFHFDDPMTESSKELAVYASTPTCKQRAKFFIYSAPLYDEGICLGGVVKDGSIRIEKSLVEQEH